ncbi:Spy/CpxP family protein refolding chaperone [Fulvivirga maritima]|uniref:Spy/CpxP family protein refolding chaperone n=1 Tax=Fulvivirga maritima TaxID=2904247 RepID=UPI001F1723E6|nr:Spy/CpxP family protein refolding chaperone [Fulvivirga maritima]UII29342.1 Spy/CpxP family protein refolding chaperone [Fulvivirga maritima]
MKNSKFKIAIVAFLILGSSVLVSAQQGPGRGDGFNKGKKEWSHKRGFRGHGPGDMIPNLTDEQKDKMKEMRLSFYKETLPLKNELNEKKAQLRTLTTVESPDMKKVNKLIENMGDIEVELKKARVAHHQEVRSQLTEEQRIFFDSRPMGVGFKGHRGRR